MNEFTVKIGDKEFTAKEPTFDEIDTIKEKTGLDLLKGNTQQQEQIVMDDSNALCLLMAYVLKPVDNAPMTNEEKIAYFRSNGTLSLFTEVILSFFGFFKQRMNESKGRFQVNSNQPAKTKAK